MISHKSLSTGRWERILDPPERFKIPLHTKDLVYPKSRYQEGQSPLLIYLPSRKIMFQIMRACIGVDHVSDLWFNLTYKSCENSEVDF